MMDSESLHFIGESIQVSFDIPPVRQKTPPCPDGFTWQGREYHVVEKLAEWVDFSRRGRSARNMQPAHAAVAASRGSLGVGRFYFQVRAQIVLSDSSTVGQPKSQVFDIYYDREIKDVDDRLGHWFLYRELSEDSMQR
jgi:hypothetical protein